MATLGTNKVVLANPEETMAQAGEAAWQNFFGEITDIGSPIPKWLLYLLSGGAAAFLSSPLFRLWTREAYNARSASLSSRDNAWYEP